MTPEIPAAGHDVLAAGVPPVRAYRPLSASSSRTSAGPRASASSRSKRSTPAGEAVRAMPLAVIDFGSWPS